MKVEIGGNNIPPIILNDVISSEFRFRVYESGALLAHFANHSGHSFTPPWVATLAGLGTASLELHAPFK